MNTEYDTVFVTHLPAFYKVNLYNAIAKQQRILVIFLGASSKIRTQDFSSLAFEFESWVMDAQDFEQRSVLKTLKNLAKLWQKIRTLRYHQLVVGGWDRLEFWMLVILSPSRKNYLALESSVYESQVSGLRGAIKKFFLTQLQGVYASGAPHIRLLQLLKYPGEIKKTLGVGLFNYQAKILQQRPFSGKFLYVGRLAPEKNLLLLIKAFQKLPEFTLTIIGDGPLKSALRQDCLSNVTILGYVSNIELASYYQAHDVFILPSLSEPWGLVVEEALYYGLPVIASGNVGCAQDLIVDNQLGLMFNPADLNNLISAICAMQNKMAVFRERVIQFDFTSRDKLQVQQYKINSID